MAPLFPSLLKSIPKNVSICGVIKKQPFENIQACIKTGLHILGVNYLQEGLQLIQYIKQSPSLNQSLEWHFIGKIQSNKIRDIVKYFSLIHSVGNEKHLKLINQQGQKENKIVNILIEVNTAKEANKSGLFPEKVLTFIKQACHYKNIQILGLMTMGPLVKQPKDNLPYFQKTYELFQTAKKFNTSNYQSQFLSMGMSQDYKIAIDSGANLIRLGTILFGKRNLV